MLKFAPAAMALLALPTPFALSQPAPTCTVVAGSVRDTTDALIPGAVLRLEGAGERRAGSDGRFSFPCVSRGAHQLTVEAEGFAPLSLKINAASSADLRIRLQPGSVDTTVSVDAEDTQIPTAATHPNASAGSTTLEGKDLLSLADDPDDLLRELQQMAAMSGGNPLASTISVNGFQDSSKLPPKSSIAYIEVNPDLFSAEYRNPPFGGGRVNVYTKPGQSVFHGALFATNGSPWMNARDPFSLSKAALGKQRYGFELSGPLRGRKDKTSDFALTLEHRSIDNYAVVNAVTAGANGSQVNTVANVAQPERLWVGEARVDWQLGAKNTLIASFDTSTNNLQNIGVGGLALAETGYAATQWDNVARFVDITTISPHLMHEAHLSFRWDGETDTPNSAGPSISVSGAFTGGGSTYGARGLHELKTEIDDDAILTLKHQTLKFGTQMLISRNHDQLTTGFNSSYVFGSLATYATPTPTPTAVTAVTGNPEVDLTQITNALYIQDDWKLRHGVMLSGGLRYYTLSQPLILSGLTPRLSVLWAPGKKPRWTFHAHVGTFTDQFPASSALEMLREDGVHRITQIAYNPTFNTLAPGTGNVFAGTTPIATRRTYSPHYTAAFWSAESFGGTAALPGGFNVSWDALWARLWNQPLSVNVNTPLDGNPYGARPLAANTNIWQEQNAAQGHGDAQFLFIQNGKLKWLQGLFGVIHLDLISSNDDGDFDSPQSAYSNAGEFARQSSAGNGTPWMLFSNETLTLPGKVQWSVDLMAGGRGRYNITTGVDNNGDGNFNDRPQFATPGQAGAIQTPYGLMIATGGFAPIARNAGVMPWTIHFDSNIQRAFTLTRNPKSDRQQVVTLNLRSSNLLNHTNVTTVGGVLGSPTFGVPYAADNGRRVEGGVRYSF